MWGKMDAVFYNINLANGCQRAAMLHSMPRHTTHTRVCVHNLTHTHTLAVNSGNFLMVDINTKLKTKTIKNASIHTGGLKCKSKIFLNIWKSYLPSQHRSRQNTGWFEKLSACWDDRWGEDDIKDWCGARLRCWERQQRKRPRVKSLENE